MAGRRRHPENDAGEASCGMKKVLLIGSGGSGKSTLAKALSARTGLPLFHLDALYWRPGWDAMARPEWTALVERLVQEPEWIMDGNYGGTLDQRLATCDTVVLLDLPPWLCLWRLIRRRFRHAGKSRPEMAPGCPERLDAAFLWWVASYRKTASRRPVPACGGRGSGQDGGGPPPARGSAMLPGEPATPPGQDEP